MKLVTLISVVCCAIVLVLVSGPAVQADLTGLGPVDPVTDFPTFFTDQNGLSVGPCDVITDPAGGVNGPPCGALALHDFNLGFVTGNVEEVTYYRAEAVAGSNSRLRIEVQGGACLTPGPCTEQIVSNAAGLRLQPGDMTIAGDYTVVTPVGTFIVPVADPTQVVNVLLGPAADGFPATIPPFGGALPGAVQFFVSNGTGQDGFLGDSLTEAVLHSGEGWPLDGGELVFRVTAPDATVTINQPLFTVEGKVAAFVLTVSKAGNGNGLVTSSPAGITCGGDCSQPYDPGTLVALTPTPNPNNAFLGWTGCDSVDPSTDVCSVTMTSARTVVASFGAPDISVNPASHSFGTINLGSLAAKTFTVTNVGQADLVIGEIMVSPAGAFSKGTDTCSGQSISPSGTCTVQGRFVPALVAGVAADLSIPSNDAGTPTFDVVMSGFGTADAVFNDVPGNGFAENFINSLFNNGITGGCSASPPLFCPDDFVTRGEMAVFVVRSLDEEPLFSTVTTVLSGAEEAPTPVITGGTGTITMTVDVASGAVSGNLVFSGLTSNSTIAHIHEGPIGVAGPPIVTLIGGGAAAGVFTVPVATTLTPPQVASLVAGNLYFNVHSVAFSGGEIRGQILSAFNDVPIDHNFYRHIGKFSGLGITAGCVREDPATIAHEAMYCPDDLVSRAQMAVFLEKAIGVAAPPPCTGTRFNDVSAATVGATFCGYIEDFAARGITAGCAADIPATVGVNEAMYCPGDPVTRAEMAVFLIKAFFGSF